MSRLQNVLILTGFLVVFFALTTWNATATVTAAPGESGNGFIILGDDIDVDCVSIEIPPLEVPHLSLERGSTAVFDDHMAIKTNAAWKLTVEDATPGSTHAKGHMEPYISGAYIEEKDDELTYGFEILVKGIGDNDGILQDAIDFSNGPIEIMRGISTDDLEKNLYFRYSQRVSEDEIAGNYRIDLIYSLSKEI